MKTFKSLGVLETIADACLKLGWQTPLPIQISAIPAALNGRDIVGTSETGSGKTAAFLIPILQKWIEAGRPTGYALILAPTRELACQTAETASRIMEHISLSQNNNPDKKSTSANLNVFKLIGGENSVEQAISMAWCRHHIIVATPGRLLEHMKQSPGFAQHHLSTIKQLVLDEADRMLSMEFADDIDALLDIFEKPVAVLSRSGNKAKKQTYLERRMEETMSPTRIVTSTLESTKKEAYKHKGVRFPHPQTHLYTATMSRDVTKLRRFALDRNATVCTAVGGNVTTIDGEKDAKDPKPGKVELPVGLKHFCLPVRRSDKLAVLDWLIQSCLAEHKITEDEDQEEFRVIVFCARCHETRFLAGFLKELGHSAVALTGRLKQSERRRVLSEFTEGRVNVLVATDVASRGLDIPMVAMVINYGVPLTSKTYRHRVGRTARAGRQGIAVTIVTRDEGMAYVELERALLPVAKGKVATSIPRWPHALLPEQAQGKSDCMFVRRRLTDEAWSRAAKKLREEEALKQEERRAVATQDSSSSDEDNLIGSDDQQQESNPHWSSGAAGIEAARRAHAEARERRRKVTDSSDEKEEQDYESEEENEDIGNLKFIQPIKERRASVSAAKKQKKTVEARKYRRPRD